LTANGMKVATVDSSNGNCYCTVKYYHLDMLGNTRLITSPSNSITFSNGYQPFGQDNGTPNNSENYKFTSKPYSATTGLYYYYQRWYDPSIGRFMSVDAKPGQLANPQSLNTYVYVRNLPTSLGDPTGMFDCGIVAFACNAVGTIWNGAKQGLNTVVQVVVRPVVDRICSRVERVCDAISTVTKATVQGIKTEISALPQRIQQFKNDVTQTLLQAYQDLQYANRQVNQAIEAVGNWASRFHITDTNRFVTGLVECAGLVALVALTWEVLPEEVGMEAVLYGAAVTGTVGPIGTVVLANDLMEVAHFAVNLAVGCGADTFGSVSMS